LWGTVQSSETRTQRLLLVRHGESDWNARGLIQGHSDVPTLTEGGRAQALSAVAALQEFDVTVIVSSDQRRAHETAVIIGDACGLEVTTTPELRERSFGSLEGQTQQTMDLADIGIVDGHIADIDRAVGGGESLSDVYGRVGRWADGFLSPDRTGDVVVVAHGGSIRMLRAYLNETPLIGMPWGEVPNAGITIASPPRSLLSASPH
jgi:broad specificity phosphatase PhoE